ncbi:MAG: rhodanese-like domain-containing protein [Bacteroidia bacterium]
MKTIQQLLNDPATKIIDVRSPGEFASEHLPEAINIPVETIANRIDEIKSMNAPVRCYCRSGARSGMAVSILKQAGMQDVYNGGSVYDLLFELQKN